MRSFTPFSQGIALGREGEFQRRAHWAPFLAWSVSQSNDFPKGSLFCQDCPPQARPSPCTITTVITTTHWQLQVPRREALSVPFAFFDTLHSTATMMRTSIARATRAAAVPRTTCQVQQFRQAHAISNPTLAKIESRWEGTFLHPMDELSMLLTMRRDASSGAG